MRLALGLGIAALAAGGLAFAQSTPQRTGGYLPPEKTPDAADFLPPPPEIGSPQQLREMEVYRSTRAGEGGPRWALAASDNDYSAPALMAGFSCAVGARLTAENAPRLRILLSRVTADAGRAATRAKEVYQRKRPYVLEGKGDICIAKSDGLAESPDYPSGHAALGWAAGLVLAELAPERAGEIVHRGRAFGESRIYCGVHTPSAVEGGRMTASAVFAALHSSPEFMADMAAARAEITAAKAAGGAPDAAACEAEARLIAEAPR